MTLVAGKKEPPPSMLVLFDPAKSAEPPQNSGSVCAIALITSPEAARVAISFPGANTGMPDAQFSGSVRFRSRCNSAAFSIFSTSH